MSRYAIAARASSSTSWRRIYPTATGQPRWHRDAAVSSTWPSAWLDEARRWAASKGYALRVVLVNPYPHLVLRYGAHWPNAAVCRKLEACARRLGRRLYIRSGRRTMTEQWALYRQNMNPTTGQPYPGHPLTAYPNTNAPHVRGVAADVGVLVPNDADGVSLRQYPGGSAAANAVGLRFAVASEPWHVEG